MKKGKDLLDMDFSKYIQINIDGMVVYGLNFTSMKTKDLVILQGKSSNSNISIVTVAFLKEDNLRILEEVGKILTIEKY